MKQLYPIYKCGHDEKAQKNIPCVMCNESTCVQCHKLDENDEILCEKCFRNKYPEEYQYAYELPDEKDQRKVVVMTMEKMNGLKEMHNDQSLKPKIILNWAPSRIVKGIRDWEMKKLKMILIKKK
jgi:hypothetical protein